MYKQKMTIFCIIALNGIIFLNICRELVWKLPPSIVLKAFWYLFFLICLISMPVKKIFHMLFFQFLYGILILVAYIIGNSSSPHWMGYVTTPLLIAIPIGVLFSCVEDKELFYHKANNFAYIISILGVSIVFFQKLSDVADSEYNMSLGFSLSFALLFIIQNFLDYHKVKDALLCVCIVLSIFMGGSRGALFPPMFFLLSYLVKTKKQKIFKYIFIGIVFCISCWFLMPYLIDLYEQSGYRFRTVDLLLKSEVHMSGRDLIYEKCWQQINKSPLLGHGIAGFDNEKFYPHSLFLEIYITFGYIIGTLINLGISFIFAYILFSKRNHDKLLTMFCCLSIGELLFSGSLFLSLYFFLCMYNFFLINKKEKQSNENKIYISN